MGFAGQHGWMMWLLGGPQHIKFLGHHASLQVQHVLTIAAAPGAYRQAVSVLACKIFSHRPTPGLSYTGLECGHGSMNLAGLLFGFGIAAILATAAETALAGKVVDRTTEFMWG